MQTRRVLVFVSVKSYYFLHSRCLSLPPSCSGSFLVFDARSHCGISKRYPMLSLFPHHSLLFSVSSTTSLSWILLDSFLVVVLLVCHDGGSLPLSSTAPRRLSFTVHKRMAFVLDRTWQVVRSAILRAGCSNTVPTVLVTKAPAISWCKRQARWLRWSRQPAQQRNVCLRKRRAPCMLLLLTPG